MKIEVGADIATVRKTELKRLADEISQNPDKTFLFSDEQISLLPAPQLSKISADFSRHFSEIEVLIYLRRQDLHSISMHQQSIKHGNTQIGVFEEKPYYNYEELLAKLSAVFGETNIRPRIFERESLVGQDVLDDFFTCLGLSDTSDFVNIEDVNQSPSYEAMLVLNEINRLFEVLPDGPDADEHRGRLRREMQNLFPGPKLALPAKNARAFYSQFTDSNARVQEIWFPDRPSLFSETFKDTADAAQNLDPDSRKIVSMIVDVATQEIVRTRNDLAPVETDLTAHPAPLHPKNRLSIRHNVTQLHKIMGYKIRRWLSNFPLATKAVRARLKSSADRLEKQLLETL